ncbi:MAG: DUF5666 domain-containing protein [Candidatus Rokuibacteriota bacterium]
MPLLRSVLAMALAVLLIAAVAGAVSAANHTAAPQKTEEKPAAAKAAKPAAEKTRRHVGTVKAVDAAGKTLTVEEKSGDATVAVTDKTTIKRGKDSVKLEDLKAGDQVTVVYAQQNGKDVARSIITKAQ